MCSTIGANFQRFILKKIDAARASAKGTRAIQYYLGHHNIHHTTRYTELAADRFKDFWRD
jgi:hypothetical protein